VLLPSDLAVSVAGSLLTAGGLLLMLRREPLLVMADERGLHVGARSIAWDEVRRLQFLRGGAGTWLRVDTDEGLVELRDLDLAQPPDTLRRTIVDRAGLQGVPLPFPPRGVHVQPGDSFQEWARPGEVAVEQRAAAGDEASGEKGKGKWGVLIGLAALLGKYGKAALLFGTKSLKLGQLLPTLLTMLGTVWVYALAWGWWFAGGFVGLLLLHEMGHALVIRAKGLRTSPIVFIPFVGAFISIKDQFRDARTEAETAWGGPAAGALAATGCFVAWLLTGHELLLGLANVGFLLNLFNLLPVSPLDGGRVVTAISTWLWVLGLAAAAALGFWLGSPLLIIILVLGGLRAWREWKRRRSGEGEDYFRLTPRYRVAMAGAYFGLCAYLAWMTHRTLELGGHLA
jgi:Zn-dependent protease